MGWECIAVFSMPPAHGEGVQHKEQARMSSRKCTCHLHIGWQISADRDAMRAGLPHLWT